jgi:hypothetical protein
MLNWFAPEPNDTTAAKLGAAMLATVAKTPAAILKRVQRPWNK